MVNEKRLIDATDWDSFYADMGDSRNTMDSYDRGYMDALDRADDWMDAQPTVDAVEVVRCKDCIHWDSKIGSCDEFTSHRLPAGGRIAFLTRADDFCSYGERRTDDDGDA